MRRLLLVFCLLLAGGAARAQSLPVQVNVTTGAPSVGTITNVGDTVTTSCPGEQWASFEVATDATFNGTLQPEVSFDGTNWSPTSTPYATNTSVVAIYPATGPTITSTATAGKWEVVLPATVLTCRARATAVTTAGVVTVRGKRQYVPGRPVVGTLYDVTSATNTQISTGVLDLTGWTYLSATYTLPTGTVATATAVDDAGVNELAGEVAIASSVGICWIAFTKIGGYTIPGAVISSGTNFQTNLRKRMVFTSPAAAAATSRIRIEVSR